MKILMVPHDPEWGEEFEREAERIGAALGDMVVAVHHIGSTAIPGVHAKPIIDILLVVDSVTALDEKQAAIEAMGYRTLGEFGIPGRRYFPRDDAFGNRTHQVHAFENGSAQIKRHLAFRDYMIAHPAAAQEYSDLKRELAAKHADDSESYMDGKEAFIEEIDRRAVRQS